MATAKPLTKSQWMTASETRTQTHMVQGGVRLPSVSLTNTHRHMMETYTLTLTTNCGMELTDSFRVGNVVHARNAATQRCKALLGGETFGATFTLLDECGHMVDTQTYYA